MIMLSIISFSLELYYDGDDKTGREWVVETNKKRKQTVLGESMVGVIKK